MIFASSGIDHKIKLWDISKFKNEIEKALFFTHSGHKGMINDFSWNNCKEMEIISVDSKN